MKTADLRRIAVLRNDRLGDLVCTLPLFEALRQGCPACAHHGHRQPADGPAFGSSSARRRGALGRQKDADGRTGRDAGAPAARRDSAGPLHGPQRAGRAAGAGADPRDARPALVSAALRHTPVLCFAAPSAAARSRLRPGFCPSAGNRLFAPARPGPTCTSTRATATRSTIRSSSRLGSEGPLFAVHPGGLGSVFNWPLENYLETVERLAAVGRVIMTPGPADREATDWIVTRLAPEIRKRLLVIPDLGVAG